MEFYGKNGLAGQQCHEYSYLHNVLLYQVLIKRLSEPYAECVDTSDGKHDFTRNVYEEWYPETLYTLEVGIVVEEIAFVFVNQTPLKRTVDQTSKF